MKGYFLHCTICIAGSVGSITDTGMESRFDKLCSISGLVCCVPHDSITLGGRYESVSFPLQLPGLTV